MIGRRYWGAYALGVVLVACTADDAADVPPTPVPIEAGPGNGDDGGGGECTTGAECASGVCTGLTCAAATSSDGVKNGDESDIDCGGTSTGAPKCAVGKGCNVHADCTTDGCDDTLHCALGRSCTQLHGGRTCGAGDALAADHTHESCCVALDVPGGAKLDKYQITAGRMRQFLTRLNGNVKAWVQANRATLPAATQATLPPSYDGYLPEDMLAGDYAAARHVGGWIFLTDRPSPSQGCAIGPDDADYHAGSHTYWLDASGRALTSETLSVNPQDRLDEKSLNCVTYPVLAAFCAWDGGRLASRANLDLAYGGATYPWGSATPSGYGAAGGTTVTPPGGDLLLANYLYNYYRISSDYEMFHRGDYTAFVAPPGRYPNGQGPHHHMDVAGNLLELTSTAGPNDGKYGPTVRWSRNGSFEGHTIGDGKFAFAIMTKYGKTGGRCER